MARLSNERTCSARTKRGERCRARAVTPEGHCAMHGGLTDPRELGRLGGQSRSRKLLGISDTVADENLRAKAKKALEQALSSENDQVRLRAAQSLYSYRAAPPPSEREEQAPTDGRFLADGRRVVNLADVLELCLEGGVTGIFESAQMQDVILRAADRVRELQAEGIRH